MIIDNIVKLVRFYNNGEICMQKLSNNNRLDYIDSLKGFGIMLVILGHIYSLNNGIRTWIYSFHMPLFFIISGILFKRIKFKYKNFKYMVRSKFKSLIIPYIIFNIINISLIILFLDYTKNELIWQILYIIALGGYGALWFLPALFIAELLFCYIDNNVKNNYIKIITLTILSILPYILIKFKYNFIGLVLYRALIGLGFFCIGYIISEYIVKKEYRISSAIVIILINLISCILNGRVELFDLTFGNIYLYIISSISGSIGLILLFKRFKNNSILNYAGKYSLIIMSTHQILIEIIKKISNYKFEGYIEAIILLIIIIILEYIVIKGFRCINIKYKNRYDAI